MPNTTIDKDTTVVYDFYANHLADPKSLKNKNVCLLALGNVRYIDECKRHAKSTLILESRECRPFDGADFRDINSLKETIANWLRMHKMKKFDLIVMNPPWGDASDSTIDVKIWQVVQPFAKQVVMISSGQYLFAKRKPDCWKSVVEAKIVINPFDGIKPRHQPVITVWKSGYDNGGMTNVSDETQMDWNGVFDYTRIEENPRKAIEFFDKHSRLFKWTAGMCNGPNRKGVVHDNGQFHYYNNKLFNETYRDVPKDAKHVLCMCSYEHAYDPIHRDPAKAEGGLIWVCKNARIANNIAYWLDTPFIYMFRKRHIKTGRNNCVYDCLPQADTFDMPEKDFTAYCDRIADGFNRKYTREDILTLFAGTGAYSA